MVWAAVVMRNFLIITASMRKHYVKDESQLPVNGLFKAACNPYVWGYKTDRTPKKWHDNRTSWRVANAPMCKRCLKRFGDGS